MQRGDNQINIFSAPVACSSKNCWPPLLSCKFSSLSSISSVSLAQPIFYFKRFSCSGHLTRKPYGCFRCPGNNINAVPMWFVFCGMICCLFIVVPKQTDTATDTDTTSWRFSLVPEHLQHFLITELAVISSPGRQIFKDLGLRKCLQVFIFSS